MITVFQTYTSQMKAVSSGIVEATHSSLEPPVMCMSARFVLTTTWKTVLKLFHLQSVYVLHLSDVHAICLYTEVVDLLTQLISSLPSGAATAWPLNACYSTGLYNSTLTVSRFNKRWTARNESTKTRNEASSIREQHKSASENIFCGNFLFKLPEYSLELKHWKECYFLLL